MAATVQGTQLTEQHRRSQLSIRAAALRTLLVLFPAFTMKDIDASWLPLEAALMLLITQARTQSSSLARAYYLNFRNAEGIRGPVPVDPPPLPIWEQAAHRSLTVTGPVAAKQAIASGRPQAEAREIALVRLSGSVGRLVLNGGRDTITGMVSAEPQRVGWIRVTSASPCAFCAMFATRGPIYKETTVGFQAHDHCACTAEPIVRNERSAWPARNRELLGVWNETTRGLGGREAILAFRAAIER